MNNERGVSECDQPWFTDNECHIEKCMLFIQIDETSFNGVIDMYEYAIKTTEAAFVIVMLRHPMI